MPFGKKRCIVACADSRCPFHPAAASATIVVIEQKGKAEARAGDKFQWREELFGDSGFVDRMRCIKACNGKLNFRDYVGLKSAALPSKRFRAASASRQTMTTAREPMCLASQTTLGTPILR